MRLETGLRVIYRSWSASWSCISRRRLESSGTLGLGSSRLFVWLNLIQVDILMAGSTRRAAPIAKTRLCASERQRGPTRLQERRRRMRVQAAPGELWAPGPRRAGPADTNVGRGRFVSLFWAAFFSSRSSRRDRQLNRSAGRPTGVVRHQPASQPASQLAFCWARSRSFGWNW